jgi:hypothetical protein
MPLTPYDAGPITDDGVAEDRVLDRLKLWLPSMLAEHCAARGLAQADPAPDPGRGYAISSFDARHAEQTPPMVVVHSPGTLKQPAVDKGRAGIVRQWQRVNVVVTAGGRTEPGTRGKALRLVAAVRRVLLQQVRGDAIQEVQYLGARYDLPLRGGSELARTRLVCSLYAAVLVPDVVATRGVFADTPIELGQGYPTPDSARITVRREVTQLP